MATMMTTDDKMDNKEKKQKEINNNKKIKSESKINIYLLVLIVGVSLSILVQYVNVKNRSVISQEDSIRKYWVYGKNTDDVNGHLKHVHKVLKRVGYSKTSNDSTWSLFWSHSYPFNELYSLLSNLKPYQKVNHFPGTHTITRKVALASQDSKYIPKAFQLPKDKKKLWDYAEKNKDALFLVKNILHRGVHLKNVSEIDYDKSDIFIQEYMQKPFLVDGHKFDIGVYVAVTSVDPLRVYWYKGDVLFRYCPKKYYPFDAHDLDKYVIADDYRPTWEIPSLSHTYNALGYGMKDAFDIYAKSKGGDTEQMWLDVLNAIAEVFVRNEKTIMESLKKYKSRNNFFEMMRFDLIVDENLKVYLLESNMSPNLSSEHFPPNQLLYEQVLYNLLSLTGVSSHLIGYNYNGVTSEEKASKDMISSFKNIAVFGEECSKKCKETCNDLLCGLCNTCMDARLRETLLTAHTEHLHRGDFQRLFPPTMNPDAPIDEDKLKELTFLNKMQHLWYQGKCNNDYTWCV